MRDPLEVPEPSLARSPFLDHDILVYQRLWKVVNQLGRVFPMPIGFSPQTPHARSLSTIAIMPQTPHVEKHFTASETVRDIVIGMSDGLTVPFALAAGLSGAVDATTIVITAGMAEVAAGSIAMGLGGYLAAKTDAEHFASEQAREERETIEVPEVEAEEVAKIFREQGLPEETVATVVRAIRSDRKRWVDFMMKFELGLEPPDPHRARRSALTIALSYIAGGFVPLAPYFFIRSVRTALIASVVFTLLALLVFGYIKGRFTTAKPMRSAWQTVAVGGLAAAAAFLIAKAIG
jgi:VIT1/CCC1 family predicted Fe2+/Mn2+ transporter